MSVLWLTNIRPSPPIFALNDDKFWLDYIYFFNVSESKSDVIFFELMINDFRFDIVYCLLSIIFIWEKTYTIEHEFDQLDEAHKNHYSSLFYEFERSFSGLGFSYYAYFIARRAIYISYLYYLEHLPVLQVNLGVFLSVIQIFFFCTTVFDNRIQPLFDLRRGFEQPVLEFLEKRHAPLASAVPFHLMRLRAIWKAGTAPGAREKTGTDLTRLKAAGRGAA